MNILLLGSGGREFTLAWKMAQSPRLNQLYIAPGNAGTSQFGQNLELNLSDFEAISQIIDTKHIKIVVVGPEAPLVDGVQDYLSRKHPDILCVGPSQRGAQLEGSKSYAKKFMEQYDIPTAAYIEVTNENIQEGIERIDSTRGPIVLKADGLAAGKGVIITEDKNEAKTLLKEMLKGKFGEASSKVVIEEFLDGIEFSVFVLTDGQDYTLLPHAKDYKRIGEGDTGLNTGGMGCISPPPFADNNIMQKVAERIINPTIHGIKQEGMVYNGFIFFGLILVGDEPYVIEYNCRLGDPETEVILPRLENDIVEMFEAVSDHKLKDIDPVFSNQSCATVMMVSGGYPESYQKGYPISLPETENDEILIIHAGTKLLDGQVVSNGGRVIAVTSFGTNLREALSRSYQVVDQIDFRDSNYRRDIGFDVDLD